MASKDLLAAGKKRVGFSCHHASEKVFLEPDAFTAWQRLDMHLMEMKLSLT